MTNEREERAARNAAVIEEFRANAGLVGGRSNVLILHTTGARTGAERVNPVAFQPVESGWAIFGTRAGAPRHPDWYHNLVAHPDVSIEVGADTVPVRARTAEGEERERIWTKQTQDQPGFAEYESRTDRVIPVVILERRD